MANQLSILINTIEELLYEPRINEYLDLLESFIEDGYELVIYRKGDDEAYSIIKDVDHFNNFKRGFRNKAINTY